MSTTNNNHVGICISKEVQVILNTYDNKLTVPGYASSYCFAHSSNTESFVLYKKYCHAN